MLFSLLLCAAIQPRGHLTPGCKAGGEEETGDSIVLELFRAKRRNTLHEGPPLITGLCWSKGSSAGARSCSLTLELGRQCFLLLFVFLGKGFGTPHLLLQVVVQESSRAQARHCQQAKPGLQEPLLPPRTHARAHGGAEAKRCSAVSLALLKHLILFSPPNSSFAPEIHRSLRLLSARFASSLAFTPPQPPEKRKMLQKRFTPHRPAERSAAQRRSSRAASFSCEPRRGPGRGDPAEGDQEEEEQQRNFCFPCAAEGGGEGRAVPPPPLQHRPEKISRGMRSAAAPSPLLPSPPAAAGGGREEAAVPGLRVLGLGECPRCPQRRHGVLGLSALSQPPAEPTRSDKESIAAPT